MTTEEPRGLQFPCSYEIKAMGVDDGYFEALVVRIVKRHCDAIQRDSLRTRASRNGRYVSVSLTITARDREQLDAIYDDLTADARVLMRL